MSDKQPPTLYEWIGGQPALERLTTVFYQRVREDPLLRPLFEHMDEGHPHFVAVFLAEVFGGPKDYSAQRGGHPHMIRRHLERYLTQEQRARWMHLLLECADATGIPDDPEFRSALVGYIEWGTRIAVITSQTSATPIENAPMPLWGWGEVGGPYTG